MSMGLRGNMNVRDILHSIYIETYFKLCSYHMFDTIFDAHLRKLQGDSHPNDACIFFHIKFEAALKCISKLIGWLKLKLIVKSKQSERKLKCVAPGQHEALDKQSAHKYPILIHMWMSPGFPSKFNVYHRIIYGGSCTVAIENWSLQWRRRGANDYFDVFHTHTHIRSKIMANEFFPYFFPIYFLYKAKISAHTKKWRSKWVTHIIMCHLY